MLAPDSQPLSRSQRHQVIVEWNDSRRLYPGCQLLHHLFETRAAESPAAVAVVSGGDHLSYAELDRLADLLARHLRSLGVGPESAVGLCLDGGLESAVGILAILKAGGAYVPLDPAYPAGRLRGMLRDAEVSVLLTRRRWCRRLGVGAASSRLRRDRPRVFCLDPGWQRSCSELPAAAGVAAPVDEECVAYVIFTSGSTGRPKGVAVSHRAVVNRLRWSQEAWPLSAADRVLQQASTSFDFSVWELFASWMAGALVVLVSADQRRDMGRLADLVLDAGITVLHFVPSLLAEFLTVSQSRAAGAALRSRASGATEARRFGRLRRVYSGGEALQARLRDRTQARLGAELINQYGPTEATIDATFWHCRRGDRRPAVPIGRPIANTRTYLLGTRLQPVPAGVTGEIHIAGVALARGYLGRPGRTAASFIPDPLTGEPGERLYRTGDLARYLGDGTIDFIGRRDHQVQLRGVRIELGEIEAVLERHPDVRRAVVVTVDRPEVGAGTGGPMLVAWVMLEVAQEPGARLRGWLQERLPDIMIPAVFLALDSLPLTPTGKVDLRLLADRAVHRPRSGLASEPSRPPATSFVAPRTPQEGILAEIWSEVLEIASVGVHDHFFELGGHSLLAGRVVSRIRRIFHLELPVSLLFERPTIAGLARGLALRQTMQLQTEAQQVTEVSALEPRPRGPTDRLPLSFAQERLWLLDRLEPLSPAYNLPSALRLTGPLDAGALEGALHWIVHRHEVLRTRFPSTGGKPRQEILPCPNLRLAIVDLARLAQGRRLTEARSFAATEAQRPFDLARGPLLRATLLRLAPREHVLLLTLHHIVFDGWSRGILHRELTVLYRALSKAAKRSARVAPAPLPELPLQVADVALWQRRWLRDEALATLLSYWRRQLGERPPILELPTDRPRPARPSHLGASHQWTLGESLTAGLKELSIASGASLYMTLLAAFMAFLHRLTQQRQILVGAPIAGRGTEATEDLIGLFVNTLVMRGDLGDSPRFTKHLARVRATALQAYAHQELPFEKLVEELQPERDPSRNPVFQVTLVLHNAPAPAPRLDGLELRPFDAGGSDPARFDLALYLRDGEAGLRGTMVGLRDLFDRTTIARFCRGFKSLLEAAVTEPDRRVTTLPIMSSAQRHQLLVEWANSNAVTEDRRGKCLHHLFEAQVARAPEAVALVFEAQRLSYYGLDRGADRLARAICRAGAPRATLKALKRETGPAAASWKRTRVARVSKAPKVEAPSIAQKRGRPTRAFGSWPRQAPSRPESTDDIVAICLERGPEMVVAVLAVLKAGAAFLYLDPAYPRHRRLLLLADARVRRLLTTRSLAKDFDAWEGQVLRLDGMPGGPPRWGTANKRNVVPEGGERDVAPDQPAYVTYTSGSTGRAKGVIGTHQGAADYLRYIIRTYGLGPNDVTLQIASLAFDRAVRDLLAPLVAGATVVMSSAAGEEPERLPREAERQRVTCLPAMAPSLLRQLDALAVTREAATVRLVLFAGERLTRSDCRRAASLFGRQARLVNLYGPTEGTCTASAFVLDVRGFGGGSVAIGRPHPRVSIYLLDRALRPVPAGAAGELTLGGSGLARGYLGRPAATARAFVPSPLAGKPGARLYRTGDLARHRGDGNLELSGRIDHQLKIRGFRIEPGEVEAALTAHPAVRAAVVAGEQDAVGDLRLVAHVQAAGALPGFGALRRFLRRTLPDHLVPSVFVPSGALPLTAGGKVDRAALARRRAVAPLSAGRRLASPALLRGDLVAPRDPIEEILVEIWHELLGVEDVGVHDHFFELGGHSLLAARVVSRIRHRLGVELPLRRLFERPTVAGLARAVARAQAGDAQPLVPILEAVPRPPQLPLSFAQERMWFLDRLEPMSPAYNMASAWRLSGRLDTGALGCSLHEICRRHEVLRSRFPTFGEEPSQVIAPRSPARPVLSIVDLERLATDRRRPAVRSIAAVEAARPFDLAHGPLLRAALLRLGGEEHVLLLAVHHIVSDAWSQSNFYRELAIFYHAGGSPERASGATESGRPRAPELPVQYADYALWQRGWLRGPVLDAQLDYWKEQLGGGLPTLRLPTDRPRLAARSDLGGVVPLTIPGEVMAELKTLSSATGASLFMSLLAAFAALLSRYSGQLDVVVGSPVANRGRAEIEPLIGLFANTLVLRTDLSPGDRHPLGFRELLERVRNMTLEAYAHQDTPFERLVDALQPVRSPGSSPLFQVMFALHNAPVGRLELAGLECAPLPTARPVAKFDLSLSFRGGTGELLYKVDLFDATRIRRMARHLITLLDGVVRDPDLPLARLSLLSVAERQQLVVEWNATRTELAGCRCLHQLFEHQAAQTPDRIALVCGDRRVTYGQLDERANRLARSLKRRGVGRGDVVPVLMPPGLDVPTVLLAVMKSGAAYSPLDVRWPWQRRARILDELESGVLLDDGSLRRAVSTPDPPHSRTGTELPVALVDPIYAIYTSGSTGEPKASVNTHGGIVNRLLWMDGQYGRDRDRVVLQTTHHTFDSSVWQLFWPLLHGGRTVVSATREGFDLDHLIDVVERQRVTFTDFVPSVFDLLVDRLEQVGQAPLRRRIASLRQLIIGGEAINPRAIERARRILPEVGFSNLYGPTETAIGVTCHHIDERPREPMPIGRPIDNVAALILDDSLIPVPAGVPGEIHLGGVCVGLGYLGDPGKSAKAFIADPFSGVPGRRLYKTGDLARYQADGNIEFLGRVDHQIKIRGFRIEPAEIESVLIQHPSIREAVAVVQQAPRRGYTADDRRLVAYVVAPGEGRRSATLRDFLERRLPRHMVPAELVRLEALPVTPGGKVDRVALETRMPGGRVLDGPSPGDVAPRTPIERQLAAIWSEVLGLGRPDEGSRTTPGVFSDFFALGGHSLLAVRLMSRIERRFQVRLPLSVLFERPTIAGLAEKILEGGAPAPTTPLVLIRSPAASTGDRPDPFFCVHPVGGQVLCYRELAGHLDAELPFYGLRAWGSGDGEAFDPEVGDMAARYCEAIRDFQPRGPYRLGGWSMGGVIAFEIAHRLHRRGEEIEALVLIDTSVPAGESGAQPCESGAQPCESGAQLVEFARDLGLVEDGESCEERLAVLGVDDGLRQIMLDARRAGILSADIDLGRIRDLYGVFGNNLRALRSYRPAIYPGTLTLLRSRQRPASYDTTLGWRGLVAGGVEVVDVPGDHFTMLREPHVRLLAERLEACLGVCCA